MKKFTLTSLLGFSLACLWLSPAFSADASSGDAMSGSERSGDTLEDFFTAAIDYSPRLRIAAEGVDIGSARVSAANGRLLPQVNANASVYENTRDEQNLAEEQEYQGERYSLQLNQVLFNWSAFAVRNQAYLLEDQLEAEYFGELAWLLTDVADKYFNVLQASDAVESSLSEQEAVTTQLELIQSYYDRQLVQITDLYEAQARVAAVRAELLDLQNQLALSREALRSITGVSPGPLYQLSEDVDIPAMENGIEYWVGLARADNYIIRARELAVDVADERVSEQRGAYMPRVSLIAQQQNSNIGFENVQVPKSETTYFGVDISIPLFAGGSNRAAVREAASQRSIARYELLQTQLEVNERTRTAYLQVVASESRTDAARQLVESTTLRAEAMRRGFELSSVTTVDVLNALRDQFLAERDLQRTRYDHIRHLLVLKREAGTLTAEDLMQVGGWLTAPEN
ncbi:MAG: TolC family outer membrane protein [Pseudohongiellaceae bacterium]